MIQSKINELGVEINNAQAYLNSTDYKVIKWAEGVETPDEEIKTKRQEARDTINACAAEIEELKLQEAAEKELERIHIEDDAVFDE